MIEMTETRAVTRWLAVADWTVDPDEIVAELRRLTGTLTLVVPAWLHGLDWAGDPTASVPCAQRQLDRLVELSARAGLDVEAAGVGDPDVVSAVGDALEGRDVTDIVVFARPRRARHPLDLAHRIRRATGLPVRRVEAARRRERRRWALLRGAGHCQCDALLGTAAAVGLSARR